MKIRNWEIGKQKWGRAIICLGVALALAGCETTTVRMDLPKPVYSEQ